MEHCEGKASRQHYLCTLSSYIKASDDAIKHFTQDIGWTEPPHRGSVLQVCNSTGKPSESNSINEYSEEPLLPSFSSSPSLLFSVKLDAEKQRSLLQPCRRNAVCMRIPSAAPDFRHPPASAGELTVNFTREERLMLYEHTLKNATPVATPSELLPMDVADTSEGAPKELSGLELKKALRDFKRRRQAYRTKVSTKNKSQTEVTREIILNMMGLLGMEDPESDLHGTSNRSEAPQCNPGDNNDGSQRGMNHPKQQEHKDQRPRRSELERYSRNRSPRESVKYHKHDTTHYKEERKHRRTEKRHDKRSEDRRTPDKYHSRGKDRESSQSRERRREKDNDESKCKDYEHRKRRRYKKEEYENERRHHRQETFPNRYQKRERS